MLFSTTRQLELGDFVDLELSLPDVDCPLRVAGRAVHVDPAEAGLFHVAIGIAEIADQGRPLFASYLQRLTRKQSAED